MNVKVTTAKDEHCDMCSKRVDVTAQIDIADDDTRSYGNFDLCIACLANITHKIFMEMEKTRLKKLKKE